MPRFEQSSAGYHRLPPAIAVTLAAASRRQFHWHSPAPPAFTGSTSIHRLHRIVMGRYIDNSSGVKMVYLQLPIAVQLQINHFNAAGIIGISSRNDPQTTSLRRAPRNMSWEPALFSLWAMVSLGCTVTRNALLGCQLRLYRLKLIKSIQSYLGLYDGTTDTEFLNHFQWWKIFLKKSKSESLSHAWLLIWGITDHCRMINGWVLTKNVQKIFFHPWIAWRFRNQNEK